MIETPKISIITVVYNGEAYLQQTINSIKKQTYKNVEYIIIDGGSTDKTIDIINDNEKTISKWVSEPDNGLYDAMNKGIKMASGELIGIVNSDDWYENNTVEQVVNAYIKNKEKKIFHGDKNCIKLNGDIKLKKAKNNPFLIKYYGMVLNHPTMFVHKDIYKHYQYNTQLRSVSDYQFTLTNYLDNKNKFHYIPQVLSNFRLGGISGNLKFKKILSENYIARKNAGMNFASRSFALVFRILVEVYFKLSRKKNDY
ncbi:glycosyltransferase family 2 protein [Meridianimaribacter flavus]|uniref:Glycosyl transferase family 2 n=1 Tax=Meridianimaribacter flavus TaxID=571115 RepID=A0ABY2G802_9FLAO|nr:glycosyltransferase family 2 protein [Meridianimaribacter flavus]TDY13591.1 glycosyl transferase family 2 [Meridianimaribacter flavus]